MTDSDVMYVYVHTLMDCTLLSCVHNLYMAMEAATRIVITGSKSVYLDENRSCTVRKEHTPESEIMWTRSVLGSAVTYSPDVTVTVTTVLQESQSRASRMAVHGL